MAFFAACTARAPPANGTYFLSFCSYHYHVVFSPIAKSRSPSRHRQKGNASVANLVRIQSGPARNSKRATSLNSDLPDSDGHWWWSELKVDGRKNRQAPAQLRGLLVGDREEEDFFLILEILERTQNMFAADLDHTSSLEEAKAMLKEKTYGLVLFEHETGVTLPFIVLSAEADETTVAEVLALQRTLNEGHGTVWPSRTWMEQLWFVPSGTHTYRARGQRWRRGPCRSEEPWHSHRVAGDGRGHAESGQLAKELARLRPEKNCCSFLVMPARLGSTIKSGTLRPIFSRNPDHSGSNSNRPKSRLRPNEFPHSPRCATMRWIDRHLRRPYNQAARAPHESFNHQ